MLTITIPNIRGLCSDSCPLLQKGRTTQQKNMKQFGLMNTAKQIAVIRDERHAEFLSDNYRTEGCNIVI